MRVWLIDDRRGEETGALESILKQLGTQPEMGIALVGARPFWPDFAAELCAQFTDVVVIHEPSWPEGSWTQELMNLGAGIVAATTLQRRERFRALADQYPIVLAPFPCSAETLFFALASALTARNRNEVLNAHVTRLQQRLNDRIVIERAKGLLVQQMGITEEEAYNRLRVLSRRQRRQIRDIAQSLIDTQSLFRTGDNGNPLPDADAKFFQNNA